MGLISALPRIAISCAPRLPHRRLLMQRLSPGAALTHVAIDEVLNLLHTSASPSSPDDMAPSACSATTGSKQRRSSQPPQSASTGSLPKGMRAWVEGDWLVVNAGSKNGASNGSTSGASNGSTRGACISPVGKDMS